jgi:hypothetical protein
MGYSDQKFQSRPLVNAGTITGTATASGTNSPTGTDLNVAPPQFIRKTVINSVNVECAKAVPANFTSLKFILKNGTNTAGSVTVGTGTAGQVFAASLTAGSNTYAAGAGPTFVLDGTSTASGQSLGTFNVFFEVQELFS